MTRSFVLIFAATCLLLSSCQKAEIANQNVQQAVIMPPSPRAAPATPTMPNLQAELTDDTDTTTDSPIGRFDFKNFTYELPRGWQNPDGSAEITLKDGSAEPLDEANATTKQKVNDESTSLRRIGLTLVATKFFDVTGDGEDEAIVVLKIETGGSAIPQIVHIFTWKNDAPELIWPFRTGDRSDGGLKNIYAAGGLLTVELYGQDRFLLGQTETGRITDDIEQLCCPTHFTRTVYKWNGKDFLMQGKRLTYLTSDPQLPPVENMGDAQERKNVKR